MWAGWLLCVVALATPAPFALLPVHDAGRVVGRMLAEEAYVSLALGVLLFLLERTAPRARRSSVFSLGIGLALGTLFCTVAGYFALLPMMEAARAGQGSFSFGQLHAVSASFFGVKILLVLTLAWRNLSPAPSS
ncbi:MAG: DUF4149 domain-containing protein [Burkholderiales bacterium]|nr:DUF4149 domain-containing protein [Burkholderiales bacterium]MDE2455446.1 DUF4149 domain-containing protein [Burkholderiales bacterium]